MKILGIVGSKRKKGNTSCLVQAALKSAEKEGAETELIFLGDYSIADCKGCEGCKKTYKCVIKDDMQKIYPLLLEADGIIMGSPTYFYNITADVKAFIDRCYSFEVFAEDDRSCWVGIGEALGTKYAAVIAVCEQHDEKYMGFTAEAMAKPLVDLGYRVVDTVKTIKAFGMGDVLKDENSLKQSERAGERLAKTIKLRKEIEVKLKAKPICY
ncbi:NADPH-dependent FMN reductase [Desulforamulus reducens MI-1]|uniref:NADPH-dependent FMN reductase n=1 Tax=Desulforamulus reducens (strain ATCC BAA-1160 / DSM 100696 / MI-1) TaxID=349161 RepID=A4J1P5_DESRM|nr:flavodoxin family protein [Desulforamulus reducens]ABO48998.1 NADPH-dependent FMN reductase [Desulforamulus reducens MI-1]